MAVDAQTTIQRSIQVRAPQSRVWRALTEPSQFGNWFQVGIQLESFRPGEVVPMVSNCKGYEGLLCYVQIVEVVPESRFSWRWFPGSEQPEKPLPEGQLTLVTFELEPAGGGTKVTVTETGFENIPDSVRARAIRENNEGWDAQMVALAKYLAGSNGS